MKKRYTEEQIIKAIKRHEAGVLFLIDNRFSLLVGRSRIRFRRIAFLTALPLQNWYMFAANFRFIRKGKIELQISINC